MSSDPPSGPLGAGACLCRPRRRDRVIQYLVVKNEKSQKFGLPKGRLEEGETLKECAVREIMEETGYLVELREDHPYEDVLERRYYIFPTFERVAKSGDVDDEGTRCFAWMTRKEIKCLRKEKTNSGLKWFIRRFLK